MRRPPNYAKCANFQLMMLVMERRGLGSTGWHQPSPTLKALLRAKKRIVFEFESDARDDPDCPPALETLVRTLKREFADVLRQAEAQAA